MDKNKMAIISTGNGGQSMAAYFTSVGYKVALYAREQERVDMFRTRRFVMSGAVNGTVYVDTISYDMQEVIADAHLIMVTTPAQYHSIVAKDMAPYLADGQVVVLNPGRTFGTFEFDKVLRDNNCKSNYYLAEADTFAFTCRCMQLGYPIIYSIKEKVLVGAHLPENIDKIMAALKPALSCFEPAESVVQTSLMNIGMIFHPMPFIMNFTRVEQGEKYLHYKQGITPMVAERLEQLDAERVAVAKALGYELETAKEWMKERYGVDGINLHEAIQQNEAYSDVYAPTDIYSRYVFEDIPTGCVPLYCVGEHLGVPTPIAKALIDWATALYGFDFMGRGRNADKMDVEMITKILKR